MNIDLLNLADLLLSNGILIWLGLRMVKRIDDIDKTVNKHETRITVLEEKP